MTEETTAQTGTGSEAASADATANANTGTIVGGGATEDTASPRSESTPATAGGWPDDWRDKLAGDDSAFRKRLDRFASPNALSEWTRGLEKKMSSGALKAGLSETATPEEVAAWRKENGIPDSADGYVASLALPGGMVLGEADKPIVSQFAEAAHAGNVKPQQFNALVAKYYEMQDQQRAAQEDADATFHTESIGALQAEWAGPDYRRNVTAVKNFLSSWPADLRNGVLAARTPDGRKLGDHPAFIKQLANVALDLNPAATLVPNGGGDPAKSIGDRIADIEKLMGDRSSDYWRGPKADAMQQEYRELVEARDKLKARAA